MAKANGKSDVVPSSGNVVEIVIRKKPRSRKPGTTVVTAA